MSGRKILLIVFSCLVAICGFSTTPDSSRKELGNLIIEGIPDIPKSLAERTDQYQNVRSAQFQDWHPDGKGMLIATRFAETNQLHQVVSPGSMRRQLTFFREPVASGLYFKSKDPQDLLFSMDEGGGEFFQIYHFDLRNGKHKMLTDGGRSVNTGIVWSKDGSSVAFSSTKRNGTDFDIYVMNEMPESIRMVKQATGSWRPLDWSADDSHLLLYNYVSDEESHLHACDVKSGESVEINPPQEGQKIAYDNAAYSADQKGVYYTSDEESDILRLTYYDLQSKRKKVLTPSLRWDVDALDVSKDGKSVAFTANEGGLSKLYIYDTRSSQTTPIQVPTGVITGPKFNETSNLLAFNLSSAKSSSDVYSYDLKTKKLERWTSSEVGGLNPDQFVEPELIEYPTFDKVEGKPRMIPSFYYRPHDESKKPYPVIINIHGGPSAQAVASFNATFQYWVNELGAAVLAPNVRGSNGYGQTYQELDNGRKREDSVKDIGALLDWIATRPELDANRVAVNGGSYGGYMVLASMFHYNDRIRCGVDIVGISNYVTFLERTESYRRELRRKEYGDERDPEVRKFLESIAPLVHVKKITKPLFVIQGKNDPRVSYLESEQIVKAVRGNGVSVWYLLANDEGHGFRKKVNRDYHLNAVSLFFENYLLK